MEQVQASSVLARKVLVFSQLLCLFGFAGLHLSESFLSRLLDLLHLQLLLSEHFLDVLLLSGRLERQQLPVFRQLEHAR